jgi:hypothetical protein
MQRYYGLMILLVASNTHAFLTTTAPACLITSSSSSHLQMAGFGAGGAAASNNQKKNSKKNVVQQKNNLLKPKSQWDRYCVLLKASQRVRVAGRKESSPDEWFEVGFVKSKEDAYTEHAVIRQRVLFAEHARRLYPLQILAKDKLEWAFSNTKGEEDEKEEWVVAGKVDMPEDIEKWIGFEGLPDPTGFYSSRITGTKGESTMVGGDDKINKQKRIGHIGNENHN